MTDYQEQLNTGTKQTNRMVSQTIAAARALCDAGDYDASAQAWELASVYCKAMAIGRRVSIAGSDNTMIRPMSGDK